MNTIGEYPIVLIPMIGVPLTGAIHIMAIDSLWRRWRAERRPQNFRQATATG
ncbi:MAG: hypothetical protein H7125_11465 [Proteobacteria bacterium]|nr:hypothetical protein [Burkholderiales bacterium]